MLNTPQESQLSAADAVPTIMVFPEPFEAELPPGMGTVRTEGLAQFGQPELLATHIPVFLLASTALIFNQIIEKVVGGTQIKLPHHLKLDEYTMVVLTATPVDDSALFAPVAAGTHILVQPDMAAYREMPCHCCDGKLGDHLEEDRSPY